jgi:hypothetical protein
MSCADSCIGEALSALGEMTAWRAVLYSTR